MCNHKAQEMTMTVNGWGQVETQIAGGEEVKELQDQRDGKTIYVDLGITKSEAGKNVRETESRPGTRLFKELRG